MIRMGRLSRLVGRSGLVARLLHVVMIVVMIVDVMTEVLAVVGQNYVQACARPFV